jgi:hypothetical protein
MSLVGHIYHVSRADFLERIRRPSFLALLAITMYLTYLFVPPAEADFLTVSLGGSRGIYNSPWVGTMFGIAVSVLLSLFAFYVVKNAVERDRRTNVGQILAATPLQNLAYTFGKWLSNLALLASLVAIMTIMAMVMQLVRGEALEINLWALAAPIWLMGLPVMAIVAAVALLFETVPFLRGGFGNLVYFFLWTFLLSYAVTTSFPEGSIVESPGNDLFGLTRPIADMQRQYLAIDPDYSGDFSIGRSETGHQARLFVWEGISWDPLIALQRLLWLALGALIALFAALPFDRFDPARSNAPGRAGPGRMARIGRRLLGVGGYPISLAGKLIAVPLRPVARRMTASRFGVTYLADLKIALRGNPEWWYALLALFFLLGLFLPLESVLRNLLPFAWLAPVLAWSELGVREIRHATQGLVFSTPYPLRRQLPATWLAGFSVALVSASGIALRLLFGGQWAHLLAFLVAAGFIPALALALGIWTGTSRTFEIVYLLWWYAIVNGAAQLDFMGTTEKALAGGRPLIFLALGFVLLALAAAGRYRQLNR